MTLYESCELIRNYSRMKRGMKKNQAKDRKLRPEDIERINSGIEKLTKETVTKEALQETAELKDWQWMIMLRNETDKEDWD